MNLIQKQKAFSILLARFILEIQSLGYEVTLGETWRPPETARSNEAAGTGIANSLHCLRLAVDLNLFRGGKLLQRSSEYQEVGTIWKSYTSNDLTCCWGGEFRDSRGWPTPDGNHFSVEHNGVK